MFSCIWILLEFRREAYAIRVQLLIILFSSNIAVLLLNKKCLQRRYDNADHAAIADPSPQAFVCFGHWCAELRLNPLVSWSKPDRIIQLLHIVWSRHTGAFLVLLAIDAVVLIISHLQPAGGSQSFYNLVQT